MFRKILALLLVISMVGMSSGLVWDFEKLFTGRHMVPYGAPWIADDQKMYFGTGKDVSLEYDEDGDNVVKVTGPFSFAEPITVTKADGTAPFTVASTTVVTNLNADKLDGQDGSYYGTASDVSALQSRTYLHIQVITDPIVAAADTIEGATAINTSGFTLASGDLDAQPDVPRTLSVTPNGELTGWVLFEGTNIDDEAITEYVNFTASSSQANTTKAFKTLTQVTGEKTAGDDRSITIGQTDELGLDMTIDNDYQIMMVKFDGGIDANQTLVKDSTDVEKNTIDVDGTLDSSKTIWVYVIVE